MAEHTELPWQLCHHLQSAEKDASCKCGYRGGIWGDAGELLVCEMRNCDLHEGHDMIPVGDRATQLANAAFIVKACNSHEALVKALEEARSFFKDNIEGLYGINHDIPMAARASITMRQIDLALALCEHDRERASHE